MAKTSKKNTYPQEKTNKYPNISTPKKSVNLK